MKGGSELGRVTVLTTKKLTLTSLLIFLSLLITSATLSPLFSSLTVAASAPTIADWWPSQGVTVSGVQPFKAALNGWNVADYSLAWSVDNGGYSTMASNYTDYPHKETQVDLSGWNWQPDGQYLITYLAKDSHGTVLAKSSFTITIPAPNPIIVSPTSTTTSTISTVTSTPTTTATTTTTTTTALTPTTSTPVITTTTSQPLLGLTLYVNPSSPAQQQANAWRSSRPSDAAQMDKIAQHAGSAWFGGWNSNVQNDVSTYVNPAAAASQVPVLVAYNIPQRDCGSYSAGGTTPSGYISWITSFANGIGTNKAIVIVEPDSIAAIGCLSSTDQATRLSLLSQAVTILKSHSNTTVYLDGGHPGWQPSDVMATRLKSANIAYADGFALNVSNFITTNDNIAYGQSIASLTGNKHFVIDTSRNGLGPTSDYQWCNPLGRALGEIPTTITTNTLVDAYLWIKAPGESDGTCNGGPSAGSWWADYALGLAERAAY
ncbi:MAG: hypothetical protein NVSMB46_06310 [Candidatus Saccharimonadales bacterium]